jgi:class 3 adenylate cyclase
VLDDYERVCAEQIKESRGRLVKYIGDGVLATFGSASDAARCAVALGTAVAQLGVDVHSGIHVGDVEHRGDDIGGTAVNIAARVMESANRRGVLVTAAAHDAADASGISFADAGAYELEGFARKYRLYRIA